MTVSATATAAEYVRFAERLTASGLVTDPWVDGRPRFQAAPLRLARADHDAIARAAEDVAAVLDELCACLAGDFDIEHSTFQLESPDRRRLEEASHA